MKTLKTTIIVFCMTLLAACQPTTSTTTSSSNSSTSTTTEQVTVKILVQGEPVENAEKTIEITEGDTVLTVLQKQYEIVDDNGLITTIDGIQADTGENAGRYWKLLVNDVMSEVGAGEATVKDKDIIIFDLTSDWSY